MSTVDETKFNVDFGKVLNYQKEILMNSKFQYDINFDLLDTNNSHDYAIKIRQFAISIEIIIQDRLKWMAERQSIHPACGIDELRILGKILALLLEYRSHANYLDNDVIADFYHATNPMFEELTRNKWL